MPDFQVLPNPAALKHGMTYSTNVVRQFGCFISHGVSGSTCSPLHVDGENECDRRERSREICSTSLLAFVIGYSNAPQISTWSREPADACSVRHGQQDVLLNWRQIKGPLNDKLRTSFDFVPPFPGSFFSTFTSYICAPFEFYRSKLNVKPKSNSTETFSFAETSIPLYRIP